MKNLSLFFLMAAVSLGLVLSGCPGKSTPSAPTGPAATSTTTFTAVPSATPTNSPTSTPSSTPSSSPTFTATSTTTSSPTHTATRTSTGTPTDTGTNSPTMTPSGTPTDTGTPTATSTITDTPTVTATNTFQPTPIATNSWGISGGTAWGLAISGSSIYVGDYSGGTVRKFSLSGVPDPTWTNPSIANPIGVAVDSSGNVYAGGFGGSYQVFNSQATPIATVVISSPTGLAYDGSSKIYTTNYYVSNFSVFTTAGALINQYIGPSAGIGIAIGGGVLYIGQDTTAGNIYTYDLSGNQLATQWAIGQPVDGIALDGLGRVYVVTGEYGSGPIRRYDTSGNLLTQWGSSQSFGCAVDSNNNLYVGNIGGGVDVYSP